MIETWPSGFGSNVELFLPAVDARPRRPGVALEPAAAEVAVLEVAGGFVETEVVEEVVQEVRQEEELRLGRLRQY